MDWRRRWTFPWAKKQRKRQKKKTKTPKINENEDDTNNNNGNSPGCEGYTVGFAAEGSLPPVALASYPGSGNTWLREVIEGATGVFTGSTYDDQHLYVTGLFGELESWSAGTTLTQKTHSASPSVVASFSSRAVVLVRNPYRALLAYHNYLYGGHLGFAPVSNYRSEDWGAFVHMQARAWMDIAVNWTRALLEEEEKEEEEEEEEDQINKQKRGVILTNVRKRVKEEGKKRMKNEGGKKKKIKRMNKEGRKVAIVHYEEVLQDPVTPLLPVLAALPVPTPSPDRLACLKMHHTSRRRFKRQREYLPENLDFFSPLDRDKLDRAIRYVDYHFRRLHLPPLPLHLYEYYNNTPPDPNKIVRVVCLEEETEAACDLRVDQLNAAWRRRKRKNEGNDKQSPLYDGGGGGEGGGGGGGGGRDGEEEKQDPLERFAGTKVGWILTQGFTSLMKQIQGNPLRQAAPH